MTRKELAAYLRVSIRTLNRLVQRGEVPRPARIGTQLRWRVADIDRWLSKK